MDLASMMRWAADRHPHRTAVSGHGRRLTYREWDERTDRLAAALSSWGVRAGDRVALVMHGGEQLASLHLAAQKLGAVSVPLSTRFGVDDLTYCLGDAGSVVVVTDPAHAQRVGAAAGEVPIHDVAEVDAAAETTATTGALPPPDESAVSVMLYTSGTTGKPKGVPRTHRAEHAAAVAHVMQTGRSSPA